MKNNNFLYFFIIGCLSLGIVVQYLFFTNAFKTDKNEINIKVKTIKEKTKLYSLVAEYPLFPESAIKLNQKIEGYVNKELKDFKEESANNWQARKENAGKKENIGEYPAQPFTFALTWNQQQLNNKFISFVIRTEAFSGGANPSEEIMTFNYNIEQKTEVRLADLFSGHANYLKTISEYVRNNLKEDLEIKQVLDMPDIKTMFMEGTAPKEKNFDKFTFDGKVIKFYFPVYQLGPRTLGERTVLYYRDIIPVPENKSL